MSSKLQLPGRTTSCRMAGRFWRPAYSRKPAAIGGTERRATDWPRFKCPIWTERRLSLAGHGPYWLGPTKCHSSFRPAYKSSSYFVHTTCTAIPNFQWCFLGNPKKYGFPFLCTVLHADITLLYSNFNAKLLPITINCIAVIFGCHRFCYDLISIRLQFSNFEIYTVIPATFIYTSIFLSYHKKGTLQILPLNCINTAFIDAHMCMFRICLLRFDFRQKTSERQIFKMAFISDSEIKAVTFFKIKC